MPAESASSYPETAGGRDPAQKGFLQASPYTRRWSDLNKGLSAYFGKQSARVHWTANGVFRYYPQSCFCPTKMKRLLSICLLALLTIMAIAPDVDAQTVTVRRGY
jgi:hypothetical protein